MSFNDLNLLPALLKAIQHKGYTKPTPIQAQSIPLVLSGADVMAGSQTGTGKTVGFVAPLLQNLLKKEERGVVRALILTPTRELAAQVEECVREMSIHLPLKSTVVFGGVNINPQINKIKHGIDVLVATPGRLLDLVGHKALTLAHVECLVLDEADRMLDMGFIHDIKRIFALCGKQKQTLLFSATFSPEIKKLAQQFLHDPKSIQATQQNTTVDTIDQKIHPVDNKRKRELLSSLIREGNWKQVLVFTRTKHGANRLAKQLEEDGVTAVPIHGNKSQNARTKALADFKKGTVRVLVATDIAARGLDIDELPHVVNFELPNVPEDYVHRIGRTGRAGKSGTAISLVCVDELSFLRDIEKLLKQKVPQEVIPGFEVDPTIKAEPIVLGRKGGPKPSHPKGSGPRGHKKPASKGPGPKAQDKKHTSPFHKRKWK